MQVLIYILVGVGAFLFGGILVGYIIVARVEKSENKIKDKYIQAMDTMERAYENPENSKEILDNYFKALVQIKGAWYEK